jgi:hypothetical protein
MKLSLGNLNGKPVGWAKTWRSREMREQLSGWEDGRGRQNGPARRQVQRIDPN